jgi:hypothetical protein
MRLRTVGYFVLSLVGLLRVVDFSNGHWVNESVELAWFEINVVKRQDPEYFNDLKKFFFCFFFNHTFYKYIFYFIPNFNYRRLDILCYCV